MAVSVIICGLVRDQERLLKKLGNYLDWREQGRVSEIIYSTWIGEVENYPGLKKFFEKNDITLLEIEEPRLVLKGGHQLHQMLAFYYGLCALKNKDQYVLKTRVDLADNHEAMLYDFERGTPEVDDIANVGIGRKILIEYAQMMYPFLCGDAQFYGHYDDLSKLVNLSTEMELLYNRLAVEQTFFFSPFRNINIFQKHFYWNLPHISEISNKRNDQVSYLLDCQYMLAVLESWWLILDTYFKIGWGEEHTLDESFTNYSDAFLYNENSKLIGGDFSDVIVNQSFVVRLAELITEEKRNGLIEQINTKACIDMFNLDESLFEEYQKFRRKFSDLPSPKAVVSGSQHKVIHGAAQHFFVKDANDSASKRYHEQITALRRENDILRKELNINFTNSFIHRFLNRCLPRNCIEFFKYKYPMITSLYAKYLMKKRSK